VLWTHANARGEPRSTRRTRICITAMCIRSICRCFTPTRWPIRCSQAYGSELRV
jgi:hypothetical protein